MTNRDPSEVTYGKKNQQNKTNKKQKKKKKETNKKRTNKKVQKNKETPKEPRDNFSCSALKNDVLSLHDHVVSYF